MNNSRVQPALPQAAEKLKRITESIIRLPTLPTVVSRMIQLVDNPKTSAASLAQFIASDQSLTARILKLANSAYYGFPREITTVNMAIVVLGFNAVKDMGLSLSVFDVFKDIEGDATFSSTDFWQHSIACGVASRVLARRILPRVAGEAFVAGLLHDIGKVILNQYAHAEFVAILKLVASSGVSLDEAELAVIGASHAQVGGWLAEKWNLPTLIVSSIIFHHTPFQAPAEFAVMDTLVSLANYLCHTSHIGNSARTQPQVPDERWWQIFENAGIVFGPADLEAIESDFLIEFDKSGSFMAVLHE